MKDSSVMMRHARSCRSLCLVLGLAGVPMPVEFVHAADESPVIFTCEGLGTVEARFGDERVRLALEGGPLELPQLPSGSGARYGDGEIEFWTKGDEATLTQPSVGIETQHLCRAAENGS